MLGLPVDPRKLFLLDGLGALISACSLGVVLPLFQKWIGMPRPILHMLAIIPCLFVVYSLYCWQRLPQRWPRWLQGIALGNLAYSIFSLCCVIYYFAELTPLGLTYFTIELLILGFLIRHEWRVAKAGDRQPRGTRRHV